MRTVLNMEYHYNVPRLILEDLERISDSDWKTLSRSKERMWKKLTKALCEEFEGDEAKAATAPAAKRRKASPPKTGLEALTVAQLKAKCEAQKLKVGGTKGVLISRLEDAARGIYDRPQPRRAAAAPRRKKKSSTGSRRQRGSFFDFGDGGGGSFSFFSFGGGDY